MYIDQFLSIEELHLFNQMPRYFIVPCGQEINKIITSFVFSLDETNPSRNTPYDRGSISDVAPFVSQFFDCIIDRLVAIQRIRRLIEQTSDEICRLQSSYDIGRVNNIESGIILETACLMIYDKVEQYRMRLVDRYLPYQFHSFTGNGDAILEKHENVETFYDYLLGF